MMRLKASYAGIAGEDPNVQITGTSVTIDPTGGTGSKVLVTITQNRIDGDGDALADVTYEFYGAAAKDVDLLSAANIKDLVDLINDYGPDGVQAQILHAPQDASVNLDDFITLAEYHIPANGVWYDCLHRDVSNYKHESDNVFWMRIGLPEVSDNGRILLGGIDGNCTDVTNGIVTLYRDEVGESEEQIIAPTTMVAGANAYLDLEVDKERSLRGPLILEARSDDLTAADFLVRWRSGER